MQNRNARLVAGKRLCNYITEYQLNTKNDQIRRISQMLESDEELLREMLNLELTNNTISEYGRFDREKAT